ncbi:hypothetical protein PMAYCL1PPCAC_28259, partial [Pristionchus mayeri]
ISLLRLAFKIIWHRPFIHRPMEKTSRRRAKPAVPVIMTVLEQDLHSARARDLALSLLFGLLAKMEDNERRNIRLLTICLRHLTLHIDVKPIAGE